MLLELALKARCNYIVPFNKRDLKRLAHLGLQLLGRVYNQLEKTVFAHIAYIFVLFLARCAASRFKKRLDIHNMLQKHCFPC